MCLCKDTIVMLARMGLSQLCLGHRVDRAVPDGIPDGLGSMWTRSGIDDREVKHLVVVRRKS